MKYITEGTRSTNKIVTVTSFKSKEYYSPKVIEWWKILVVVRLIVNFEV